ncbi:MAG: hypothetical protein IJ412_06780 [Oscillospiraceae bacterium]|nr:hypothetical protein [Oscillospiraceae bacterium]
MDMQAFTTALRNRIAQMPMPEDAESLLELLFDAYTECNGFDNEVIRRDFNALYAAMNGKTIREMDEIIYPVCTLCRDHEKAGFEEGIKVGFRLAQEINA